MKWISFKCLKVRLNKIKHSAAVCSVSKPQKILFTLAYLKRGITAKGRLTLLMYG